MEKSPYNNMIQSQKATKSPMTRTNQRSPSERRLISGISSHNKTQINFTSVAENVISTKVEAKYKPSQNPSNVPNIGLN